MAQEKNYFEELTRELGGDNDEPRVELAKAGTLQKKAHTAGDFGSEVEGQLTIDVYQTPSHIVVESTIAGVDPGDLDIDITNDSVTIRGHRHKESEVKEGDYLYQECFWGRFSRTVILPQEIDPDGAAASFKNGVLQVKLPKTDREKRKKLQVHLG